MLFQTFVCECVHFGVGMLICMLSREFGMRFTGEMSRRSVCNIGQASTSQDITRCVSQISACTACRTLVYRIAPTLCLSFTGRGTKTTIGLLPARYGTYDRNGEMEVEREREKPKKQGYLRHKKMHHIPRSRLLFQQVSGFQSTKLSWL